MAVKANPFWDDVIAAVDFVSTNSSFNQTVTIEREDKRAEISQDVGDNKTVIIITVVVPEDSKIEIVKADAPYGAESAGD